MINLIELANGKYNSCLEKIKNNFCCLKIIWKKITSSSVRFMVEMSSHTQENFKE